MTRFSARLETALRENAPLERWRHTEVRPMKFSLRDLILLTVIVDILAVWSFDHGRQVAELHRIRSTIITVQISLPTSSAPAPNPSKP